jgi:hypothetical protein
LDVVAVSQAPSFFFENESLLKNFLDESRRQDVTCPTASRECTSRKLASKELAKMMSKEKGWKVKKSAKAVKARLMFCNQPIYPSYIRGTKLEVVKSEEGSTSAPFLPLMMAPRSASSSARSLESMPQ